MKSNATATLIASVLLSSLTASAQDDDCRGGFLYTGQGNKITITTGDGIPDPIQVFPFRVRGDNFTFVITDSESTVLAYTTNNTIDLEGVFVGTCRVYGLAYSGTLDTEDEANLNINIQEVTTDGCTSVSRNFITIDRVADGAVDGGWLLDDKTGTGRVRVCLNDPEPFRVYSFNDAASSTSYSFVVTDDSGTVLTFPPGNQIDLSSAPPGICRVYGISHTGSLVQTTGINIKEVVSDTGVQDLSSNSVRATRVEDCNTRKSPRTPRR